MTLNQTFKSMDGEIIGGNGTILKVRFPIVSSEYEINLSEDVGKQIDAIQSNRKKNLERIRDALKVLEEMEANESAVDREDD